MKHSLIQRAMVMCVAFYLASYFGVANAYADAGSYSINFQAGNPNNYDRKVPANLACPTPGGGAANNPLPGADFNSSLNSLAPSNLALGQIVPFTIKIKVSGSTSPENGVINSVFEWDTKTTSNRNFGYDPSYQVYCAFIDTGDSASVGLDGNETVSFSSTVTASDKIRGNFTISGLDNGDTVVLEIWTVLLDTIPSNATGNVQAEAVSAQTATGSSISVGNQTIPLLRVQEFFSSNADVKIQKIDAPDPAEILSNITYTVEASNLSSNTVANDVVVVDTLDNDTTFISVSVLDTEGAITNCTHNGATVGGIVTCNVDFLNPLETVKITIVAKVNSSAPLGIGGTGSCVGTEPICNNVVISALNDNVLTNNSASQPTGVTIPGPLGALHVDKVPDANAIRNSGQVIYSYAVTNTGVGNISNVSLVDDKCSPVNYLSGDSNGNLLLEPTETWIYSCITTLTVTTLNTATANGTDVISGLRLTSVDTATVSVIHPSISLLKTASPTEVVSGGIVTYNFLVTNTGDDALTNVAIDDPLCSPINFTSELVGDGDSIFEPTEQWTYTCTKAITVNTQNTATANATDSLGGNVSSNSSTAVVVVSTPTPTSTPVPPTATPTQTPVPPTATPTNTPVPPTATPTQTPVPPTATPTETPVPPTATPTQTPVPPTATPTETPVPPTATPTETPVPPTATPTQTPVPPTATPTETPVPPTATPTETPVPPTATPTETPVPPTATPTETPVPPTATPTETPVPPTATPTGTPTPENLIQCSDVNISNTLFALDGNSHSQYVLLQKVAKRLVKISSSSRDKRLVSSALVNGRLHTSRAWTTTWSIPIISTTCSGNTSNLCVTTSNETKLSEYVVNVNGIYNQTIKLTNRLKMLGKSGVAIAKSYSKAAKNALSKSLAETAAVPRTTTKCA